MNLSVRKIVKNYSLIVSLALLVCLFQPMSTSKSVYAAHMGTSSVVWGIQASSTTAEIHEFNPSTDTATPIPRIATSDTENGRGIASDGTNLWYTIVEPSPTYYGDGKIHKVAPSGGPDLATIPDPFGPGGRGIGALDFDGTDLWAISYLPLDNDTLTIVKMDINTGTVLASCNVQKVGIGHGADTLAIVNGKILTDRGELLTNVTEYDLPVGIGSACSPTGNEFVLPIPVTGIDTDGLGNLLVTDTIGLYNLGTEPYNTVIASQPAFSGAEEDITIRPAIATDVPGVCPAQNLQHWDKIIFMINDSRVAERANVTAETELDIKVLDDPHKVADLKQKVLDFLNITPIHKRAIQILDVEYAITCSMPQAVPMKIPQAISANISAVAAIDSPELLAAAGINGENMTSPSP